MLRCREAECRVPRAEGQVPEPRAVGDEAMPLAAALREESEAMRTVGKLTRSPALDMRARCCEGRAERLESPAWRISAAELCGRVHAGGGAARVLALVASSLVPVLQACWC